MQFFINLIHLYINCYSDVGSLELSTEDRAIELMVGGKRRKGDVRRNSGKNNQLVRVAFGGL